jgi:hypothetical protein
MTSLLGPYDELMLVPGAFDVPGKSRTQLRMTRIYVSQKSTMYNGMYLLSASSPCPCQRYSSISCFTLVFCTDRLEDIA